MSGVTPLVTNPTSGLGTYTGGNILVSGWVWLVIAVSNSKTSSSTATTGGVPLSDVEDAGGRVGDNRLDSAEVVAVGGRNVMGKTAGGAITASTYSVASNTLSTSLTGVIIVGKTQHNTLLQLTIHVGIVNRWHISRAGSSSSQFVPGSTRGVTPNSGYIDPSKSPPPPPPE